MFPWGKTLVCIVESTIPVMLHWTLLDENPSGKTNLIVEFCGYVPTNVNLKTQVDPCSTRLFS